mgnify:CR=1 FL=1
MSACRFIASDVPLTEFAPPQDYPLHINLDDGTIFDGGADDNYFLNTFLDVKNYTDKNNGVCLEWDYTDGREKQIIEYIKTDNGYFLVLSDRMIDFIMACSGIIAYISPYIILDHIDDKAIVSNEVLPYKIQERIQNNSHLYVFKNKNLLNDLYDLFKDGDTIFFYKDNKLMEYTMLFEE